MINKIKAIDYWIIGFYLFANVFDAGGRFGIKYLSYIMVIFFLVISRKIFINKTQLFIFILCPIVQIFYSMIFVDISFQGAFSAVSYNIAVLFWMFLRNKNIDINKVLEILLYIFDFFALTILVIYIFAFIMNLIGYKSIYIQFGYEFLQQKKLAGFFGYAIKSGVSTPIVYFRSSLFLLFGMSIGLYLKKKKSVLLIFISNFFVSTTANIVFTVLIMMIFIFRGNASQKGKIVLLGMLLLGGVFFVLNISELYRNYYEYFDDLLMASESSLIKIGHMSSIYSVMFSNIRYLLFGMGAGAEFYSVGRNEYLVSQEVSQFECWRRFGLVYTILFFSYIFIVVYKLYKNKCNILGDGLVILFISTATNPQLMSPMFLTVLFLCVEVCRRFGEEGKIDYSIN